MNDKPLEEIKQIMKDNGISFADLLSSINVTEIDSLEGGLRISEGKNGRVYVWLPPSNTVRCDQCAGQKVNFPV